MVSSKGGRQETGEGTVAGNEEEESTIEPSLLSPVYGIDFSPSTIAQKILGQNPASPVLQPPPNVHDDPLPFPTLASSLKEEVLKKTSKKLFPKMRPPFPAAPTPQKTKTIEFELSRVESPSKEACSKKASSHMVLSSSCGQGGSTADIVLLQTEK